jgi:hypothetical protein
VAVADDPSSDKSDRVRVESDRVSDKSDHIRVGPDRVGIEPNRAPGELDFDRLAAATILSLAAASDFMQGANTTLGRTSLSLAQPSVKRLDGLAAEFSASSF